MTGMSNFLSSKIGVGFVFLLAVSASAIAADGAVFTDPLATGVHLDPVGEGIELGSVPLGMAVAPGGDRVAVVLSGWREQGLQIVDLKSRRGGRGGEEEAGVLGWGGWGGGGEWLVFGG